MVTSSHDHDPALLVRLQFVNRLRDIAKCQLHLVFEDNRVGQVSAIIHHHDTKIKRGRQPCQCLCHIPCSCDDQSRFWTQDFKKNFQSCSTTAYRLTLVSVKVDMGKARLAVMYSLKRFLCRSPICFRPGEAAASSAIRTHEHLTSNTTRRSASSFDHSSNSEAFAALEGRLYFIVNGCATHRLFP